MATLFENLQLPAPRWEKIPYYPEEDETIVTPCYEQLIGAGYALLKAEWKGYRIREVVFRNPEVIFPRDIGH